MANTENIRDSEDLSVFSMIVKKYRDFCKRELLGYDFTPNEISTMVYLLENSDIDTAKGISDKYGVTQSLICRSVDSLTKKGYLETTIDQNDRRVNHLKLVIEDENLIGILSDINSNYLELIFKGIEDKDVKIFRSVLESVHDNLIAYSEAVG